MQRNVIMYTAHNIYNTSITALLLTYLILVFNFVKTLINFELQKNCSFVQSLLININFRN